MPPDAPAAAAAIITSDPAKTVAAAKAVDKAEATQADGRVKVRPLKTYLCGATGEMRAAGDAAYPVEPHQAAGLIANGLADYDNPADEDAAIEASVKAASEAARAARKIR